MASLAATICSGLHICAMAQTAAVSGIRTCLPGLRILAVSAMKVTPQKTMMSASTSVAFTDRPSESPTKSAMSCTSGRQ